LGFPQTPVFGLKQGVHPGGNFNIGSEQTEVRELRPIFHRAPGGEFLPVGLVSHQTRGPDIKHKGVPTREVFYKTGGAINTPYIWGLKPTPGYITREQGKKSPNLRGLNDHNFLKETTIKHPKKATGF